MATAMTNDKPIVVAPLSPIFSGDHAWCVERMVLSEQLGDAIPLPTFFSQGGAQDAIRRYQSSCGGKEYRAAASMWSLYYFSCLAIPYVLACRLERHRLPIDFNTATIMLDENGLPKTFGLPHSGHVEDTDAPDVFAALAPLVDNHLEEVVGLLKGCGISSRLCWTNAAVYIDYTLRLTGVAPQDGEQDLDLFLRETRQGGKANPFKGCLRYLPEGNVCQARRKVCCLRYLLPNIPSCGALCALPEQRKCS